MVKIIIHFKVIVIQIKNFMNILLYSNSLYTSCFQQIS